MQQPDFEFQLGKNIHLRGVGWRGLVAFAVLISGVAMGSPAISAIAHTSAQTVAAWIGWR